MVKAIMSGRKRKADVLSPRLGKEGSSSSQSQPTPIKRYNFERSAYRWFMARHPAEFERFGIQTRTLERAPLARQAFYESGWEGARRLIKCVDGRFERTTFFDNLIERGLRAGTRFSIENINKQESDELGIRQDASTGKFYLEHFGSSMADGCKKKARGETQKVLMKTLDELMGAEIQATAGRGKITVTKAVSTNAKRRKVTQIIIEIDSGSTDDEDEDNDDSLDPTADGAASDTSNGSSSHDGEPHNNNNNNSSNNNNYHSHSQVKQEEYVSSSSAGGSLPSSCATSPSASPMSTRRCSGIQAAAAAAAAGAAGVYGGYKQQQQPRQMGHALPSSASQQQLPPLQMLQPPTRRVSLSSNSGCSVGPPSCASADDSDCSSVLDGVAAASSCSSYAGYPRQALGNNAAADAANGRLAVNIPRAVSPNLLDGHKASAVEEALPPPHHVAGGAMLPPAVVPSPPPPPVVLVDYPSSFFARDEEDEGGAEHANAHSYAAAYGAYGHHGAFHSNIAAGHCYGYHEAHDNNNSNSNNGLSSGAAAAAAAAGGAIVDADDLAADAAAASCRAALADAEAQLRRNIKNLDALDIEILEALF